MEEMSKIKEVIEEIRSLQQDIQKYREGSFDLPENFEYRDALKRLEFLRNRKRSLKRRKN